MRIDISFLPALATAFLLTFARVGAMVMLMPGVGELSVPARVRLTIALALTAILLPAHQKAYAVDLKTFGPVLVLLFQELIIGAVLGPHRAVGDFSAANHRLRRCPATGFGLCHSRRSDPEPAGSPGWKFFDASLASRWCLPPTCITLSLLQ